MAIQLVDSEVPVAIANEVDPATVKEATDALLPTIVIIWDPTAGVQSLKFDEKKHFRTWPLLIAALGMAKEYAENMLEQQQLAGMRAVAMEQQRAEQEAQVLTHQLKRKIR